MTLFNPFFILLQETTDRQVQETDRLPKVISPGGALQHATEEIEDKFEFPPSLLIYCLKMFYL